MHFTVTKNLVLTAFWAFFGGGNQKFLIGFVQIARVAVEAYGDVKTLIKTFKK